MTPNPTGRDGLVALLVDALAHADTAINTQLGTRVSLHRTRAMQVHDALKKAAAALRESEKDKGRLDWLADRDNHIGQVLLPTACVEANLHDMRAAIDAAMQTPSGDGGGDQERTHG